MSCHGQGDCLKIDDKIETILTTLAQSHPPNGRVRWTLQLLADRLVALTRLESLSYEAVRLALTKNDLKPWQRQKWCIPTVIGARFVWRMEDILDLYAEPYQLAFPLICFDEVPYQMVSETKLPLPMRNGKPGRYDFEYRREGTCNLFMFLQPLAGWRHIKVTDQRTKQDFAWCMKDLVENIFQRLKGSEWCWITSTHIHPPLFTRPLRLSKLVTSPRNWSFTIRLNIAVG